MRRKRKAVCIALLHHCSCHFAKWRAVAMAKRPPSSSHYTAFTQVTVASQRAKARTVAAPKAEGAVV